MLRRARAADSQFEIIGPQKSLPDWLIYTFCHEGGMAKMPNFPRFQTDGCSLMHIALDGDRGGFTAADAECRDTALQVLRFHRMQQGHDQSRAGGADRMAERTGAAVDVEFFAG